MIVKQHFKLLSQGATGVGELDGGDTDDSLEELSLKDNLFTQMDVIWLDSKALVELFDILLFLFLIAAAGFVVVLLETLNLGLLALAAVDEIEFVDFVLAEESEVVLASVVVDAIKLGDRAVGADHVGVAKEAPHLSEGHGERLLALYSLNLLGVLLVPALKLRVVSEKDILALLFDLKGVLLEVDKVRDVDKLAERILLDFFLGLVGSASLR